MLGLTVTHGNSNNLSILGRNACHILDMAHRPDIPVYLGSGKPLVCRVSSQHSNTAHHRPICACVQMGAALPGAPHVHGENGLGNVQFGNPSTSPIPRAECSAAEFIVSSDHSSSSLRVMRACVRILCIHVVKADCMCASASGSQRACSCW